jgi:23S rRNA (guanosine2251-2'-O)-methyltransferase
MDNNRKFRSYNDREPREQSTAMIFGTRSVIEAIRAGKDLDKVMVQKGISNELFRELRLALAEKEIPFQFVPSEKMFRLGDKNHQGVVAFLSEVVYQKAENLLQGIFEKGKNPLLLILDRVTDVRNFGAIARTAECAGVDAIIIPSRGSAQINGDAVKTSAGALHKIPVCREDNLKSTIQFLKDSGLKIVACTEKTDRMMYEEDLSGPMCIIMGSEENGVSPEYLKMCDGRAKIPMQGSIESLNVSVSTAVIIYEVIRQRIVKDTL